MGNVLAICEYSSTGIRSSALPGLNLARQAAEAHGGDVIAVLIGAGAKAASESASKYASKVVVVDDAALANYMAESYAPIVARLVSEHGASVVAATATSVGKDLMPRVAALLNAGMASDVASIEGKNTFVRAIAAGNAFSKIEVTSELLCVTARQSAFDPAEPFGHPGGSSRRCRG